MLTDDLSSIKRSLSGKAGFGLNKGMIELFDADAVGRYAVAKIKKKPLPPKESLYRNSAYDHLSGTATLTQGLIRNNDLQLKSANVDIKGKGNANLVNEQLDYRTTLLYGKTTDGRYRELEGLPISVDISGTFTNPKVKPDYDGLLKEMNTPEARRGLAAFVEFVKGLGAPQGARAPEEYSKQIQ